MPEKAIQRTAKTAAADFFVRQGVATEMETCRLCRKARKLRKSHVIPELVYRPLYDTDSRALYLDGGTGKRRVVQKGYYEPLLCGECETIFQRVEHYFSILWHQRDPLPDPVEGQYLERNGFDFDQFFRFHLSILWRASVAHGEIFSAVSLGPFEEPFRQFLIGDVATLEHEPAVYACVLRRPRTNELWNRMVLAPVRSPVNGITTYTFVFAGCSWYYCVSKHGSPFPESLRLKRPGSMIMPVIDYTEESSITRAWEAWQRSKASSGPPTTR